MEEGKMKVVKVDYEVPAYPFDGGLYVDISDYKKAAREMKKAEDLAAELEARKEEEALLNNRRKELEKKLKDAEIRADQLTLENRFLEGQIEAYQYLIAALKNR